MSDRSARAANMIQNCVTAVVRAGRRLLACIRRQTLIILRASGWFYHLCLAHTRRFSYRIYFHCEVFCLWTLDRLGHHLPILWRRLTRLYWLWLGRAWRFCYRIWFHLDVLYHWILDRLGHHLPILWRRLTRLYWLWLGRIWRFSYRIWFHLDVLYLWILDRLGYHLPILWRRLTRLYWLWLGRTWRVCYRIYFHLEVLYLWILDRLGYHLPILWRWLTRLYWLWLGRTWRFCHRIWFHLVVMGTWISDRLRHYTPLFLLYLRNRTLSAWRYSRSFLGWLARGVTGLVHALLQAIIHTVTSILRASRNFLLAAGRLLVQVSLWLLARLRLLAQQTARGGGRLWRHTAIISARIGERLYQYALLMRLNKPIGILLLLWPTLWALWIAAEGTPDLPILGIFVAGVVLTRSAGCVMNDFADRGFDAHVSRTRQRPLTTGKVSPREALLVAALLALCALWLVLQLNLLTVALAVVAVVLAVIYPYTKRHTYVPQFFLGLAFGWAVPMAFAAQTGAVPPIAWVLLMITVLWALVYDTLYAMVDREEDIELGIKSTAILFEEADRVIIGIIQLLVVLALLLVGTRLDFNRYYYGGLAVAGLLFVYQQYLIRERYPVQCFLAFLNNNWFGAVVFSGIAFNYYYQ